MLIDRPFYLLFMQRSRELHHLRGHPRPLRVHGLGRRHRAQVGHGHLRCRLRVQGPLGQDPQTPRHGWLHLLHLRRPHRQGVAQQSWGQEGALHQEVRCKQGLLWNYIKISLLTLLMGTIFWVGFWSGLSVLVGAFFFQCYSAVKKYCLVNWEVSLIFIPMWLNIFKRHLKYFIIDSLVFA